MVFPREFIVLGATDCTDVVVTLSLMIAPGVKRLLSFFIELNTALLLEVDSEFAGRIDGGLLGTTSGKGVGLHVFVSEAVSVFIKLKFVDVLQFLVCCLNTDWVFVEHNLSLSRRSDFPISFDEGLEEVDILCEFSDPSGFSLRSVSFDDVWICFAMPLPKLLGPMRSSLFVAFEVVDDLAWLLSVAMVLPHVFSENCLVGFFNKAGLGDVRFEFDCICGSLWVISLLLTDDPAGIITLFVLSLIESGTRADELTFDTAPAL